MLKFFLNRLLFAVLVFTWFLSYEFFGMKKHSCGLPDLSYQVRKAYPCYDKVDLRAQDLPIVSAILKGIVCNCFPGVGIEVVCSAKDGCEGDFNKYFSGHQVEMIPTGPEVKFIAAVEIPGPCRFEIFAASQVRLQRAFYENMRDQLVKKVKEDDLNCVFYRAYRPYVVTLAAITDKPITYHLILMREAPVEICSIS